ncbi:hypothetical protein ACPCAJ_30505 [Streptomyces griseoincarnatus]
MSSRLPGGTSNVFVLAHLRKVVRAEDQLPSQPWYAGSEAPCISDSSRSTSFSYRRRVSSSLSGILNSSPPSAHGM